MSQPNLPGADAAVAHALLKLVELVELRFNRLETILTQLVRKDTQIMASIQDIMSAVEAEATVEQSIITLLGEVSAQLQAAIAANDPVAMQSVVDSLNANAKAMSDAIVANTPAAPAGP